MRLNNNGFTLVELLAVFVVLGVLMAVTIPNIVGISEVNKLQNYAEDVKKFKNSVEYRFRGDSTIEKPQVNGECIIANLRYVAGSEFDNPPYGGEYMMDQSFVVMAKVDNQYKYYVQLIEDLPGDEGYRGVKLKDNVRLDAEKFQDEIDEGLVLDVFAPAVNEAGFVVTTGSTNRFIAPKPVPASFNPMLTAAAEKLYDDSGNVVCEVVKRVYYVA